MLISGLIFWYSTRQASINGNGKVAPAPLSSILCVALEFSNGSKVPIKSETNSNDNVDAFKRALGFGILTFFGGIGIVIRKDKRLLWLVPMISVFYIAIRKENRLQQNRSNCQSKPAKIIRSSKFRVGRATYTQDNNRT